MSTIRGMMTVTEIYNHLNRLTGNLVALQGAGGAIERAINDAYLQTILKYKHAEFEVRPPYLFDSQFAVGVGTSSSWGKTITTNSADIGTYRDTLVGSVFSYDDDSTGQTIQAISAGGPPYTITVTPEIATARVAKPFKCYITRYLMPFFDQTGQVVPAVPVTIPPTVQTGKRPFYIYDITDKAAMIPLKQQDVRVFDRSAIVVGNPVYYARVNNEIVVYPAPFRSNGVTPLRSTFQLRFALRPEYKQVDLVGPDDTSPTLDPMPEEWQRIVIMEAYAMLLDDQNEYERATATRDAATRLATELMKPYIEEIEDAEAAFTPRLGYQ